MPASQAGCRGFDPRLPVHLFPTYGLGCRRIPSLTFDSSAWIVIGRRQARAHLPQRPPLCEKTCWTGTQIKSSLLWLKSAHLDATQLIRVWTGPPFVVGRGARKR